MTPQMQIWLKTRPQEVQGLAREVPPDAKLMVKGVIFHVIGYSEGGLVIISKVDPDADYERAIAERAHLHIEHVRKGEVTILRDG